MRYRLKKYIVGRIAAIAHLSVKKRAILKLVHGH